MGAGLERTVTDHRDRQPHCEGSALALPGTAYACCSAMEFNDVLDNRQPETQPSLLARARGVRLTEPVEDVRKKIRVDSNARVSHGDFHLGVGALKYDLNVAALWRELDCIGNEIPNHLLQPIHIATHGTR